MSFNPGPIGGNQGNRHFAISPLQSIDGSEGFLVIVTAAQPIHGFGWVEYRTANGNLRWYSFQDFIHYTYGIYEMRSLASSPPT